MTRYLTILATALLLSCSGQKDPEDTGGGDDDDCGNSVVTWFPENAEDDAYFKTDVRLTLEVEDATAVIHVLDPGGAEIAGDTTVDGELVTWSGGDLEPLTTYTTVLNYECGEAEVTWTTSDVGPPVGDATPLENLVFALDLTNGDWLKPAGVGPLLSGFLGDTQIFVSPILVTDNEITVLGGIGSPAGQDLCSPTIPFPPAQWVDPFFELNTPSLQLSVADIDINIEDLALSGAFSPTADRIQGASLAGSIDTRALVDLVEEGGDENAVCLLVESLGVACEECTNGDGPFCLTVYVDSIGAANLPGQVLQPRTDADILADTTCTPPPA